MAHFVTDRTKITPVFLSVGKYIPTVAATHVTFARNFYEKMGLCVDLEDEILFSVFYHQNPYLLSAAVFNCGEKRKSAFLMGDTCAESYNINHRCSCPGQALHVYELSSKEKGCAKAEGGEKK